MDLEAYIVYDNNIHINQYSHIYTHIYKYIYIYLYLYLYFSLKLTSMAFSGKAFVIITLVIPPSYFRTDIALTVPPVMNNSFSVGSTAIP